MKLKFSGWALENWIIDSILWRFKYMYQKIGYGYNHLYRKKYIIILPFYQRYTDRINFIL